MTIPQRVTGAVIAIGIVLPMLWFVVYVAWFVALNQIDASGYTALILATVTSAGGFALFCIGRTLAGMRWRRASARRYLAGILLGCALPATVIGAVIGGQAGPATALVLFALLCAALTFYFLKELPAEALLTKRQRDIAEGDVRCPTCRYSMRGLYKCECPECGERFTLDQLYAANIRLMTKQ